MVSSIFTTNIRNIAFHRPIELTRESCCYYSLPMRFMLNQSSHSSRCGCRSAGFATNIIATPLQISPHHRMTTCHPHQLNACNSKTLCEASGQLSQFVRVPQRRFYHNWILPQLISEPKLLHKRSHCMSTTTTATPLTATVSTSTSTANADIVNIVESTTNESSRLPITTFTEEETMIQDAVRQWGQSKLLPVVREMDTKGSISSDIIQDLFHLGYMGIEIPDTVSTGGAGLNFTSAIIVIEEIARIDPSVAILVDIHNTLTINAIRTWGTPQQQDTWLPRLATNTISAFCLSESQSGSDAFALQTTATLSPDQSYYTINGTKSWISNAQQAGMFLVFANTNPSHLGYKGITAFLVDASTTSNTEGSIIIGKPEDKLGLRASSTCQVIFDNVRVDANTNVLGTEGMGYKYCIEILNEGRIGIAAQQLGIAKACLYDIALPYMIERKQFGQSIASFQGMQHQYALAATEIHAAETMIYNACRMKENNINFIKEASMCKYYAATVAERTASKTIEWLGGIGYTQNMLAEKFFRDCKVGSIYEGTSNIQLQTIAKLLLNEYNT